MHQLHLYGSQVRYWIYHPDQPRSIVMIHGFRGNHVGLERIIAGLPGYRVVVPDLPGYGLSTPMTGRQHDVAGLSDFVVAFMAELKLAGPVVLLGHSFGSIVVAHLAARHPNLASELILVNPIAISPRHGINRPFTRLLEAYYWLGTRLPERYGAVVIGSKSFNRLVSLCLAKTWDRPTRRLVYRHHLSDLDYPQHRAVIGQSFADSLTKTVLDDAANVHQRTLLIAGARDAIVPAAAQRRLQARLPRAELILIPRVGHLIHLETPASAAQAINDFLG